MNNRHPIRLMLFVIVITSVALGCGITLPASAPAIPTVHIEPPPAQPPQEITPIIVQPTVYQPAYARAQIGSYLSIWVTYDPADWDAPKWIDGTNQSGEQVQQLTHKGYSGCSLHDNLGHGVPPNWSFGNYTKEIGKVIFQIDQWTDTTNNNPVLVIYQYPVGEQSNSTKRLELEPGSMPYDCITATEAVIALSAVDLVK